MYDLYGSTLFIFCYHISKQLSVSFCTMQFWSSVNGVTWKLQDLLKWCEERNLHKYNLKVWDSQLYWLKYYCTWVLCLFAFCISGGTTWVYSSKMYSSTYQTDMMCFITYSWRVGRVILLHRKWTCCQFSVWPVQAVLIRCPFLGRKMCFILEHM